MGKRITPGKGMGKVYKSTLMKRVADRYVTNVEERPGFRQSQQPPHLQPPRPTAIKAVDFSKTIPFERVPTYQALRDVEHGRTPSTKPDEHAAELNSKPTTKPVDFVHSLLHTPPTVLADGQGALTHELAMQMVTHPSHSQANRGSSPHNMRLSFMGRRVLELHLQLFFLHAARQEAKSAPGGVGELIDTQRKLSVAEEDALDKPAAVVAEESVAEESTVGASEEERPSWEQPTVPSFASSPTEALENQAYGQQNMWNIKRADGVVLGDGTPGKLAEEVLDDHMLGFTVGRGWNVDQAMRYLTHGFENSHGRLNNIRGSIVQSVFGGVSHAYGVGFTSRLFHARTLPLMKDRLPEWTWRHIDEQRLKVLAEGGLWGDKSGEAKE